MIKRTAQSILEGTPTGDTNGAGLGATEFPEREFYTRKLEQALGSKP